LGGESGIPAAVSEKLKSLIPAATVLAPATTSSSSFPFSISSAKKRRTSDIGYLGSPFYAAFSNGVTPNSHSKRTVSSIPAASPIPSSSFGFSLATSGPFGVVYDQENSSDIPGTTPPKAIASPPLLSKTPVSPTKSARSQRFCNDFADQQSPLASPSAVPFTSLIESQVSSGFSQRRSPRFQSSPPFVFHTSPPANVPQIQSSKRKSPEMSYANIPLPFQQRAEDTNPLAVLVLPNSRPALTALSPPQYNTRSALRSLVEPSLVGINLILQTKANLRPVSMRSDRVSLLDAQRSDSMDD
jgi:hypothetical protein